MKPGEFTEIEVPPRKALAASVPMRPLGEVADAAISQMAAEGAAGPAALVAWLLVTLDDKLARKGYAGCWVTAAYTSAGRTWRLSIHGDLSRHYLASNLDRAIAMAEEWIGGLPAAADFDPAHDPANHPENIR